MTGLKTDTIVAELFQNFDGFVSGTVDGGSGIRIWTLNETLKSQSTNLTLTRITFADFLMGSEEITFDISNAENPVLYKDDGGKLADNVASFIQNMVSGQFDFL